jgi:hypothetical protein
VAEDLAQVIEHLPSECEAMNSNPRNTKNQTKPNKPQRDRINKNKLQIEVSQKLDEKILAKF